MRRIDGLSWLRAVGLYGLMACLPGLAACGGSQISNPFGTTEATGYSSERLPDSVPESRMAEASIAAAPAAMPANGKSTSCPQVVAWPNERLRTIYQSGHDGDQMYVVNRAEITKLSRECQVYGGQVVVKYGFAGRVLLGPKGRPGRVSIPVSVRAAGPSKQTLATDTMKISATVPANNPVGYFSMVRQMSLPIQYGARLEDYKIFVALK
ncbi:MAG: hypothetical protein ACTSYK_00135 [Alphaproteobacteria bacterium]